MFCPRCSQPQISDDVRFCSRCGFQLNVVKALLGADVESSPKTSQSLAPARARRKKDMVIGAVLMSLLALHTAWTTEDLSLDREYSSIVFKCFILCVLINVVPLMRDFFRRGAASDDKAAAPETLSRFFAKFGNTDRPAALPAAYGRPAADYATARIETAELVVAPPSVTEETTNLLRNS